MVDFNEGYYCNKCGIFEKPKERSVKGKKFQTCPSCAGMFFTKWVKPMNERIGRCKNCGHGKVTLHLHYHELFNKCKQCDQVTNVDTGEIKRPGKGEMKL